MKRINFKTVTLLFFLLLLFFNLTRWFAMPVGLGWVTFLYHHPALFYAPLTGFYLILSFFFAFFPCSKFHTRNVVCKGDAVNPCVSITFDDGPDSALTPVILDTLKKHRVPATFFLIGHQIAGNESLIRRIDSEGHEMGNHSFDHSGLWDFRSAGALRKDILKTEEVIEKIVNKRPRYFRPPYGVINPMVEWAMAGTRYLMIGWSVRSLDTIIRNEKKLLLRITGNLRPGDIILLHDNRRITAAILEKLILTIRSKGFRLVSLSELIKKQLMYKILTAILLSLMYLLPYAQNRPLTTAEAQDFRVKILETTRKTTSIESNFTQEKEMQMMAEKIVSKGKFYFRKEKKLRWEYITPSPYLIIIDNDLMYVIDENKQNKINLQTNKVFREINNIILGAVQGSLLNDTKNFTTTLSDTRSSYLAILIPQSSRLGESISQIAIYFDKTDYSVEKLIMQEASGDNTKIFFTSKKMNLPIPDEKFLPR